MSCPRDHVILNPTKCLNVLLEYSLGSREARKFLAEKALAQADTGSFQVARWSAGTTVRFRVLCSASSLVGTGMAIMTNHFDIRILENNQSW